MKPTMIRNPFRIHKTFQSFVINFVERSVSEKIDVSNFHRSLPIFLDESLNSPISFTLTTVIHDKSFRALFFHSEYQKRLHKTDSQFLIIYFKF